MRQVQIKITIRESIITECYFVELHCGCSHIVGVHVRKYFTKFKTMCSNCGSILLLALKCYGGGYNIEGWILLEDEPVEASPRRINPNERWIDLLEE